MGPVASHTLAKHSAVELKFLKSEPSVPACLQHPERQWLVHIAVSVDIYNISMPQKELKYVSTQFPPPNWTSLYSNSGLTNQLSLRLAT